MSIDPSEKIKPIIDLIVKIKNIMGEKSFDIVDHWEADLTAIGIASPKNHAVLAYIASTDIIDKFNVHLEFPCEDNSEEYTDSGVYESVSITELITIISSHFSSNT